MRRSTSTNLHIALRSHHFLLPYYIQAAKSIGAVSRLSQIPLTFPKWDRSFSLLKGETFKTAGQDIVIKTQEQFEALVAIDFLRFRDVFSFSEFAQSAFELPNENEYFAYQLFVDWYEVVRSANLEFFGSPTQLARYFSSPSTIENWWTEDRLRAPSHQNYIDALQKLDLLNQEDGRILDVGSGFGRNRALTGSVNFRLLSDISLAMLLGAEADAENSYVSRIVFDIHAPPLQLLPVFTLILMVQVSMHLSDPFILIESIVSRYLNSGGLILVDFTCADLESNWIQKSPFTRIYDAGFVEMKLADIRGMSIMQTVTWNENASAFWKAFLIKKE